MVSFEKSRKGAKARAQQVAIDNQEHQLPAHLCRDTKPLMPELSELEAVRHFHNLSHKNFSIDGQFYPLGSCTMKYNPRGVHNMASHPNVKQAHPKMPAKASQGFLGCLYDLQEYLKEITGMVGVSLAPMAGAHGEFAGCAMIKAYHDANEDHDRLEMLVPDSAHGTNPASAVMCGFKVREVATKPDGDLDFDHLKQLVSEKTAGIMLTNPSTLGVFERQILDVSKLIHDAGGLLYYDGANLNAILGKVRPGDMGFDVMHMNMHKTFATPHGGGGPGSGPVAVSSRLLPHLPVPMVGQDSSKQYTWIEKPDYPQSIGYMSAFGGNAAILFRAYVYIRMLGKEGLRRVSTFSTLNANYIKAKLQQKGIPLAYPDRMASHEFLTTFSQIKKDTGVTAMDIAKRLLDFDVHAPTTYFPLGVPECFLIEPTETESINTLDNFIDILAKVVDESKSKPEKVLSAPHNCVVQRLDEVKAAKELRVTWSKEE